jgi:hypothetical protein
VVGSQTASLTPDPSFAHNLGYRCPNCQCEGIFDIYVSRPFQRLQEHPNARCFSPCCRALNIRESRRTPNLNFSKCWASPPHLAKLGLRQIKPRSITCWLSCSTLISKTWRLYITLWTIHMLFKLWQIMTQMLCVLFYFMCSFIWTMLKQHQIIQQ